MMRGLLLTLLFAITAQPALAKDIHREKSLYRNIVVTEKWGKRCLVFSVKRGDRNQTCMDLSDPRKLVFPYVRMTFGGLLVNPDPERILVIGLGGGSIPVALAELYPDATIDVVEIDEAVVKVARRFFDFEESAHTTVHVVDARVFIKRAGIRGDKYDLVILDAFTGEYIPEHLMTLEFLEETRDILADEGVLVANTFSTSKLYDHESVTYANVFGEYFNFKLPITGNRVIIASTGKLPSQFVLDSRARRLSAPLARYDVSIETYPAHMQRGVDWNTEVRPLTDQYSPANLLQGESE